MILKGMREQFADALYYLMCKDENIILITADMGFGMFDKIRDDLVGQFYNVGAAEQIMMDMAVGLALSGKIPVTYSITPFLLFRPFETIRNYIDHENIPVKMVGSGRNTNYYREGFSHYAGDHNIIQAFQNILFLEPEEFDLKELLYLSKPVYLNLTR
jgi:transketolase